MGSLRRKGNKKTLDQVAFSSDRRQVRVRQGFVEIKWHEIGRVKHPPDGEAVPGKVKRGTWVVTKEYKRIQSID